MSQTIARHRVFREVRLEPAGGDKPESGVVLTLKFRFTRFSPRTNQLLSLLPIPVIVGMPGFLQKTWTHREETGESRGIYRFESDEQTEAYRKSPIIKVL